MARPKLRIAAVKPVEALQWARDRKVELPAEYYGHRIARARALAFSVAGMTQLDQIEQVKESLNRALEEGKTFETWKEEMLKSPEALALPRHRLDNIFRTNLQNAYMAGRCRSIQQHKDSRPYLLYDAVNDSRTRPSHAAMDGTVLPVDDPWWEAHMPPNGFRCFLPGTRVSGNFRIGLKAFYSGRAVEIVTARGIRLSITANHPILTRRGWIRADEITEGDDLIGYCRDIRRLTRFTRDVNDEQLPPTVEEVFDALASQRLGFAKPSSFDLYGDAKFIEGEVHVSGADSVLMDGVFSTCPECIENDKLETGDHAAGEDDVGVIRSPSLWRRPSPADLRSILDAATFDPMIAQQSHEEAIADSALFEQLAHDCAGEVLLDKVVSVRDFAFRGHVYDFQTENGLISANGIITHNCRCTVISLTEEQARRRGISSGPPPGGRPDNGWDYSVCAHGQEEGVRRAVTRRESRCGDGAAFADRKASILEDPVWCRSRRMRRALEAIQEVLDKWGDPERLAREALGDRAWRKHVRRVPSVLPGAMTKAHGVVIRAYTDRDLDAWPLMNALARAIPHPGPLPFDDEGLLYRAGMLVYLMDEALGQLPASPGRYLRGVDTQGMRSRRAAFRSVHGSIGKVLVWSGYTSVMRPSADPYSGDVQFIVNAVTARDISMLSASGEPELLMPRGVTVKISASRKDQESGFIWSEVEEVEHEQPVPRRYRFGMEQGEGRSGAQIP